MPSHRRSRAITYLVLAGIITLLFISHRRADTHAVQDFYSKTVSAIDKHHLASSSSSSSSNHNRNPTTHDQPADQPGQAGQKPLSGPSRPGTAAGGGYDDDDDEEDEQVLSEQRAERLREAEKKAKQNAEAKGPNKPEMPEEVVGVGSSAGGQRSGVVRDDTEGRKKEKETSKEEREVEGELNSILKKSPVIIFSKSYCPYSKRAKGVLLEKYVIEPTPFVVELDQHPLGPRMQAKLGEMTGRRTVPNVLVYGQSIGGGDDIVALDAEKTLAEKIATLGQSHIKVALRFAQTAQRVVAGGAGAAGDAPE